jgi:hypothetical protein
MTLYFKAAAEFFLFFREFYSTSIAMFDESLQEISCIYAVNRGN